MPTMFSHNIFHRQSFASNRSSWSTLLLMLRPYFQKTRSNDKKPVCFVFFEKSVQKTNPACMRAKERACSIPWDSPFATLSPTKLWGIWWCMPLGTWTCLGGQDIHQIGHWPPHRGPRGSDSLKANASPKAKREVRSGENISAHHESMALELIPMQKSPVIFDFEKI